VIFPHYLYLHLQPYASAKQGHACISCTSSFPIHVAMSSLHESRSRHLQTLSHAVHPSVAPKDENIFGPMEWHHQQSPRKKKFKTTPTSGKVMITVFWDTDGVILVDVMARGETINSDAYIKTLQKLKQCYRQVRPNRNPGDMLIQHDNFCPHRSLRTQEAIAKFGWNVFPHPLHSPDLAPSDFHLFWATEECTVWGKV